MKLKNCEILLFVSLLDAFRTDSPRFNTRIHLDKAINWLCLAQDSNKDGGVSEGYHLFHGWLPSYPETTGYIIETFLDYFSLFEANEMKQRAIRMAQWLLSIQNNDGSIPDSHFRKKMVFDTGQVILGLVRIYEETRDKIYLDGAARAGDWIVKLQDKDGSWRHYSANGIVHTYYTRVAWSLLTLERVTNDRKYMESCIKNIEWALNQQRDVGWFDNASFTLKDHDRPYTHTLAYTLDGILETGLYLDEERYVRSVTKALDKIVESLRKDGRVPGSFDKHWKGDWRYSCLTGNAQIAIDLFKLYRRTTDEKYLHAAKSINNFLKCRQELRISSKAVHGALGGSYPIWGRYIHFAYPNWASKFFADSLILEQRLSNS